MKTRIFYTKFWKDSYIHRLKPKEKLVFNYYIQNERVNLIGIYEISDSEVLFDLGITQKELDNIKQHFYQDDKFRYCMDWVLIVNYEKYNCYKGEKNKICQEKEKKSVPEQVLDTLSIPYTYPIDTPSNHKSVISNHKPVSNIYNTTLSSKTKELLNKEQKEELIEYLEKKGIDKSLAITEINKFISYWTEKNHTGTKERWQLQKTFEIKRRLTNWFNNINKFGGKNEKRGYRI